MSELADECEWLERHDHPLLNNVILNIVFQHLSGKDLIKSRLVCKTWTELTIPITRNAVEVTISDNKAMEDFMGIFHSNTLGIPYARFKLGEFSATEANCQEFLQVFGHLTKSIRCVRGIEFIAEDLSELLKATPNLESFETPTNITYRNQSVVNLLPEVTKPRLASLKKLTALGCLMFVRLYENYPTYLEELITGAENISSLRLGDSYPYEPIRENQSPSWNVLSLIEKLGRESSIQELSILVLNRDNSKYFEVLHKMIKKPNGLKLKSFQYYFYLSCSNEECRQLFQLILLFKDTLESLSISRTPSEVIAQFPKMSRLKKLSLLVSFDFNSRFINLKEFFPVLEELDLFQCRPLELNNVEFFLESEPCPNMKSLVLNNVFFKFSGSQPVLGIFPNLTKLSISIEKDGIWILQQIWTETTRLRYLSIWGMLHSIVSTNGMDLDSYLIGSQAHALQGIGVDLNNMKRMSVLKRQDTVFSFMNQHCHLPSIANLEDLESLTLTLNLGVGDWERPEGRKGLTDLTGYLGLYSMKRLKHLMILNCEFSKNCCELLCTDLGLESWSFKTSHDKEIIKSK